MNLSKEDLKIIADTIRTLAMDGVQKANSGHPGMPMGCADIAAVLWGKHLVHNSGDSRWQNRDRFVLSAGHGSMLLYTMLHFSGYNVKIDDLKNFRQLGSITPGHPEHYVTDGVETTTGPLGQGFANGVGMSIASRLLADEFSSADIINHYIYAIVSDGDLMEGISTEAASLAGHMGLANIIYIYDSNNISIEGDTNLAYSDNVSEKFKSFGWHTQEIDGHDFDQIDRAIVAAQNERSSPSIIIARTKIAKGAASKEGNEESHGAPLGDKEVFDSKVKLGCDGGLCFHVPQRVYDIFSERKKELSEVYIAWKKKFEQNITGDMLARWNSFFGETDIESLRKNLPVFEEGKKIATRSAGGKVLESLFKSMPNLVGGSADLAPSNKTFVKGFSESGENMVGRNIHFGVREHAMGAIVNGISYYGGFVPFGATFLVFMDYMRTPVRIAALGKLQSIFVYTHDSFFVGEDGPTHQPVEHIACARAIPNLTVIRPADANETSEAWLAAIENRNGPTMIALTRQDLPVLGRENKSANGSVSKGAYIIKESENPDVIILSSGSEVHISVEASIELEAHGIKTRVVSFPSWELFDAQPADYKKKILSHSTPKVVVEAGIRMGWERYAGNHALYITLEHYGESAPASLLAKEYGFTSDNIVKRVEEFLRK